MALLHTRATSTPVRLAVGTAAVVSAGVVAAAAFTGPAAGAAPSDGNSGDVKVDGAPFNNDERNESHVGCDFRLKFFNFAQGSYPVVFTAQAPTGSGQELFRTTVNVSTDPTFSPTYHFSDLNLSGFPEQPQQGFHVKVTVETGQGAGKHKVFWIKCAKPSPTHSKTKSPKPTHSKTKTTEAPPATKSSGGALPVTGSDLDGLWVLAGSLLTAGSGLLLVGRRLRRRSES